MSSNGDQKCPQCLATVRGGEFCSNCGGPLESSTPRALGRSAGESVWALLGKLLLGGLMVIIALIVIGTYCAEPESDQVNPPPVATGE